MRPIRKRNLLIGFYLSTLVLLLLSVIATPMLVGRHVLVPPGFIIAEETLETGLIIVLFAISFLILNFFLRALQKDRQIIDLAGKEKSRLVSRLTDAFSYIGTINVEIQEIASVLCGVTCYPQNRKAFRECVDAMAARAMAVAATPWLIVRMIDRTRGNTIDEHAVQRPGTALPTVTLGNRAVLDGHATDGVRTIVSRQRNLDLLTVFILPATAMEIDAEQSILLSAILNQIEMLFLLFRSGCLNNPDTPTGSHPKGIVHESTH